MARFLGIEIGGTKLQVVAGNETAEILERFRFAVDPAAGAQGIRRQIGEALDNIGVSNASAIGVGFGGPVDHERGTIAVSHQISGWSGFGITQWLTSLTGLPAFVDNDANVAALGEARFGAGKNYEHVFYVTLGSGVGAGYVSGRKIFHGRPPGESEFGHIRLDRQGKTVESACSGWALDARIREHVRAHPASVLARLTNGAGQGESRALTEALQRDDEAAGMIVNEAMDDLSFALSHVVHLFHPGIIILGGGLSLIGSPLTDRIKQNLPQYIMDAFQPGPDIALSALREDAVPVGALSLAINQTLKQ